MKKQPFHQTLVEAGMIGEETVGRDSTGGLRARLLRSQALVRSSVSDSLRELIQAATRSGEDPQFASLRGLAASAKAGLPATLHDAASRGGGSTSTSSSTRMRSRAGRRYRPRVFRSCSTRAWASCKC